MTKPLHGGYPLPLHNDISYRGTMHGLSEELSAGLAVAYGESSTGFFLADEAGKIYAANQSLVHMLGSPDENITRTFNLFNLPTIPEDVVLAIKTAFTRRERTVLRFSYLSMHGTRVELELEMLPFDSDAGRRAIFLVKDIGELVQAEETVRKTAKMETLSMLASGLSHDLNNIFGSVVGYATMVAELPPSHPKMKRFLASLVDVAQGGAQLVERLLGFTSERRSEQVSCNLRKSLERVERLVQPALGENQLITVHVDEDVDFVRGSSTRIEQAVANLLINARDALAPKGGGTIRVSAREVFELPEEMYIRPLPSDSGWVEVAVEDDGVGFPPGLTQKIFDPYFTSKPVGKGTGLGLAIVCGVVKSVRGGISVSGAQGKGACFRLYLPVVSDFQKEDTIRRFTSLMGNGSRCLVVERDRGIREFIVWSLLKHDYKVMVATSIQEAITLVGERHDKLDFIISETEFPSDMLAKLISLASFHKLWLLATTTGSQAVTIQGAHGLLAKPFEQDDLLASIKQMLERV